MKYDSFDFGYQQIDTFTPSAQEAFQGSSIDLSNDSNLRDLNAVHTATIGTHDAFSSSTVGTVQTDDFARPSDPNDILGTARNNGSPAMGELKPSSVVTYQGMQVSLEVLEGMGVIQRHPDSGRYFDPARTDGSSMGISQTPTEQPLPQQNGKEAAVELFPPQAEEALTRVLQSTPDYVYQGTIAKVMADGGIDGLNYQDIARDSGMSVEAAQQSVEAVFNMFTTQAGHVANQLGVTDPQACWDWLETNRPQQIQAARQALVQGRSTAELKAAIKVYVSNVPRDATALNAQGLETQKGSRGETLVKVGGRYWMEAKAAAAAGLI